MYLVKVHTDLRIQKLLKRPIELVFAGEVAIIPKDTVVCDACNAPIAVTEQDLKNGLAKGYAVIDEDCLVEVVCEDCRKKYFSAAPVFDTLEDAEKHFG